MIFFATLTITGCKSALDGAAIALRQATQVSEALLTELEQRYEAELLAIVDGPGSTTDKQRQMARTKTAYNDAFETYRDFRQSSRAVRSLVPLNFVCIQVEEGHPAT